MSLSRQLNKHLLRACLHGGGGPQVGEVTRQSTYSLILIRSRLHDRPGVTRQGG